MRSILDAAGISDPQLRESYARCRRLNARHGRTYYLATLLLPPAKRPYVHALYGFARYADEFVDSLTTAHPAALAPWGERFLRDFDRGHSDDPICAATLHTARTWEIPRAHFEAFLTSMRMDVTTTAYQTYADLESYMYGSAAVIGLQMLPILEPLTDDAQAPACSLGMAFQLTNFIRDVGEDHLRGRVYLPEEDLKEFDVRREDLGRGEVTADIRALLRFEIDRARSLYQDAEPGIAMLHPSSRDCVSTAFELYKGILGAVERAGYQVLRGRVSVSFPRRLAVALPALPRARQARRQPR
jgi:phytoene synthase